MKTPIGTVACRPKAKNTHVKFHLWREDQTGTLCGRYNTDDILPEDEEHPDNTRRCQVCVYADARSMM